MTERFFVPFEEGSDEGASVAITPGVYQAEFRATMLRNPTGAQAESGPEFLSGYVKWDGATTIKLDLDGESLDTVTKALRIVLAHIASEFDDVFGVRWKVVETGESYTSWWLREREAHDGSGAGRRW